MYSATMSLLGVVKVRLLESGSVLWQQGLTMSMFSELATESETLAYCKEIERLLKLEKSPDAIRVLKQIGRYALNCCGS